MELQGFTPAEVKGGYGYRPKEEDAEDNPLLVVRVHTKGIVYDRYPECRIRPGQKEPTGEAHCSDPGLHSAFQPRFWGR